MLSILTIKTNLFSSLFWGAPSFLQHLHCAEDAPGGENRRPHASRAHEVGCLTCTFISAGSKLCLHHHIPSCITTIEPNPPSVVASLQTFGFRSNIWIKQPLKSLCYGRASWHQYNSTHFFLHCSFLLVFRVKLFLASFFLPDTLGRISFCLFVFQYIFKICMTIFEVFKPHCYLNHFFQAPFQSRYFDGTEP